MDGLVVSANDPFLESMESDLVSNLFSDASLPPHDETHVSIHHRPISLESWPPTTAISKREISGWPFLSIFRSCSLVWSEMLIPSIPN